MIVEIEYNILKKRVKDSMLKRATRGWTADEDNWLLQLVEMNHNPKIKWVCLSKQLEEQTGKERSGKQCRERWQHQLNPSISRQNWTDEEITKLFELHKTSGNKWSSIAQQMKGRTDNIVKNFFYAFVRKSITKINSIVGQLRSHKSQRHIRPFDSEFTSKLILVNDGNYKDKIRLNSNDLEPTAKAILAAIIEFGLHATPSDFSDPQLYGLITKMHTFRLNSKKRKQSKKNKQQQRFQAQNQEKLEKQAGSITRLQPEGSTEQLKYLQTHSFIEDSLKFSVHLQQSRQSYQLLQEQKIQAFFQKGQELSQAQQKLTAIESTSSEAELLDQSKNHLFALSHSEDKPEFGGQRSFARLLDSLQQHLHQQVTCVITAECEDEWQFMEDAPYNANPAPELYELNSIHTIFWSGYSCNDLCRLEI